MPWFAAVCRLWTCATRSRGWVVLLFGVIASEATHAAVPPAAAFAMAFDLQELRHTAFRPEDGAPGDVNSMAQTTDGFLWIATSTGLFRYDGARFDTQLSNRLPSPSVRALLAEPDGSLWIGYNVGGASVVRNGRSRSVTGGRLPSGSVKQFFRAPEGTLWISTTSGLARLAGEQWQLADDHVDYSGESPDWLGSTGDRLVALTPSAAFFYSPTSGHFERRPRADGEAIRYGIPRGSPWRPDLHNTSQHWPAQTMLDRAGSLWVSSYHAVLRYRWSAGPDARPREDRFTTEMGLTGIVTAILQDREGNVWVGTEKGLDRFSLPKLKRVVFPDDAFGPLLIPGEQGDVWISRMSHPIIRLSQNLPIPALGTWVTTAFRDRDGTLWVAGSAGIFQYANGAVLRQLPLPVTAAALSTDLLIAPGFQAIAVDAEGAVWLSIAHEGLFRWGRDGWTRPEQHYRLPQVSAERLLVDAHRRLWIAYPNNQLAIIEGESARVFTAADGLNVGNVLALDVQESHAWIAGDRGLDALIGKRFVPVRGIGSADFRLASGVVETPEGELWLNAARALYRIPSDGVRSVLAGMLRPVGFEMFDWLDGLDSVVEVLRPGPTMLRTPDGRLWLSRKEGVWSIDPAHILRNPVAPLVSVEDVVCSGTRYEAGSNVSLPMGSRNLRIDYTAALLTHPEGVRFRYRLVGMDEGWQEAGQRRQAYYTNLSPGPYEFQVAAANEDGVWSTANAVLRFRVQPAYYQMLAFKIAAVVALVLVLALVFIVRLEQVQREYRRGVAARHAERERIARDIHDTLLQGVQALLFRLQMWEEDLEAPQSLRKEMAAVSAQAKSIVIEARERILMMRRTDARPADLVESLAMIGNEASVGKAAAFQVNMVGEAKSLTVDAKEQLIDIAREAVRNAYQHARAGRIAVNLEYRKDSLLMSIVDDGHGLDPAVAESRVKSSHFGLMGMRERARQLGAQFRIQYKRKTGTRVEVIVPARVAFRDAFKWPWQSRRRA